jgi:adenine-specific DNA-methyltransferase
MTPLESLKRFLKEIFQTDNKDLNFGIYKLYKLRSDYINEFIDGHHNNSLTSLVGDCIKSVISGIDEQNKNILNDFGNNYLGHSNLTWIKDPSENYQNIIAIINTIRDQEKKQRYTGALNSIVNAQKDDTLEEKIYNHILYFLELYYLKGDYGYNNRSRDVYKIEYPVAAPYDGSDTLFHWKHKDNLYIKTGKNPSSISFEINYQRTTYNVTYGIRFDIDEEVDYEEGKERTSSNRKCFAIHSVTSNNNNLEVIFIPSDTYFTKESFFEQIAKYLFRTVNKERISEVVNIICKKDFNDKSVKVADGKQKIHYEQKDRLDIAASTSSKVEGDKLVDEFLESIYILDDKLDLFFLGIDGDYFIHENLKKFLTKEKERYIKEHMFSDLNSIFTGSIDNTTIIVAKAFHQVCSKIIDILSVAEEFQKEIYEKQKFITECEYCLTIDNIEEELYNNILNNEKQIEKWKKLYGVTDIDEEFLKNNKELVLDTKYFKDEKGFNSLKDSILENIENIDEKVNGLLVHSENYQALRFLEKRYNQNINTIYINPPYNRKNSSILYKDTFKHSSWVSMMYNRLGAGKKLLNKDGCQIIAIDHIELMYLLMLNNHIYDYLT